MNLSFAIYKLGASHIKTFRRLKFYIINLSYLQMKLQKRFLRKHKNKDYYKYMVNIPPLIVKEAGLEEGDYIDIETKKGEIILKKKGQKKDS